MKLYALMENTTEQEGMLIEHGLSLYIETKRHKILFDSGQSGNFAENAQKMGVDLSAVDVAFLSHGHFDHGGGLHRFLELNHTAPVYLNRQAFTPCYNAVDKYIGLDPALEGEERLRFTDGDLVLDEELSLNIIRDEELIRPVDSCRLTRVVDGKKEADPFYHEQYLLIREGERTCLVSGCSHRGILNIASKFRPDVLVGGFHFTKLEVDGAGRPVLEDAAEQLLKLPTTYWTCHCTGVPQYWFLKERMGDRLHYLSTGMTLEL